MSQKKFSWVSKKGNELSINDIKLADFLTRMRNGIAHFGLSPLAKPENKKQWHGVILQNIRDGKKNFEVCLMEDEIRTFSDFISREYRKAVILNRRRK